MYSDTDTLVIVKMIYGLPIQVNFVELKQTLAAPPKSAEVCQDFSRIWREIDLNLSHKIGVNCQARLPMSIGLHKKSFFH